MIKRQAQRHSTVYTRFVAKIYLKIQVNLTNTKNPQRLFYFGLPFRQKNATCKLAVTEDYRVLHKFMFRGCPIINSLSNRVVAERL